MAMERFTTDQRDPGKMPRDNGEDRVRRAYGQVSLSEMAVDVSGPDPRELVLAYLSKNPPCNFAFTSGHQGPLGGATG
jgi:hypothetical protein